MDRLEDHFQIMGQGLIQHRITLKTIDRLFQSGSPLHWGYHVLRSIQNRRILWDTHKRDIGYHAFNLIAFAVLKTYFPDHRFWRSPKWLTVMSYSCSETFRAAIEPPNKYAFPYNPAGFEMAAFMKVFIPDAGVERQEWWEKQWDRMTTPPSRSYGDGCQVPHTARARLYEGVEALLLGENDVLPS
jgi:hypothetical protein